MSHIFWVKHIIADMTKAICGSMNKDIIFNMLQWFLCVSLISIFLISYTPGAVSGRLLHHVWSDRTLPGTWPIPGCVQYFGGGGGRGDPVGETLKERANKEKGKEERESVEFIFNSWSCAISVFINMSISVSLPHTLEFGVVYIHCNYRFHIWQHIESEH